MSTKKEIESAAEQVRIIANWLSSPPDAVEDVRAELHLSAVRLSAIAKSIVEISLPPDDGSVLYEYVYDSQEKIDAHFKSSGDGQAPVFTDGFARWWIKDDQPFGRMPSPAIDIPQEGVIDVDFNLRVPQGWFDLGDLPLYSPDEPGGDYTTFVAMKLFRCFPANSGHNATLFGRLTKGDVFVRDFDNDKATKFVYYPLIVDQWTSFRIRYDYTAGNVELWVHRFGLWQRVSSAPGGTTDKTASVGPIFHATSRNAEHGFGKHEATWVDYHSYRVIKR